jgi:hypothetical protein
LADAGRNYSGIGVQGSGNQRGEAPQVSLSSRMEDWGGGDQTPADGSFLNPRHLIRQENFQGHSVREHPA